MQNIAKPTLLLDALKARDNIRRMKIKADAHKAFFRPHFKTHQSGVVGGWFRREGVAAIAVSSVDMAFYFAQHGWNDITIAFPLNIRDMERINRLASQLSLTLIVDNVHQAEALRSQMLFPVNVMIELDTGQGRTGIEAGDSDAIVRLAAVLDAAPNVRLTGLLTHAGQTYQAKGKTAIEAIAAEAFEKMSVAKNRLGRPDLLLSWGDTPSCSMLDRLPPFDEWRPGNFVFYDVMQYHIGSCSLDQVAVALLCPVVGVYPSRNQAVVQAGAVHLSGDFIAAEADFRNYGYVVQLGDAGWSVPLPGAWLASLSQEHGIIRFLPGKPIPFSPGDLVAILPIHSCLTADTMGGYLSLSGETIPMFNKADY